MGIEYQAQYKGWILTTTNTAYVFRINEPQNWLQHLYWGKKLPFNSDYFGADAIEAAPQNSSVEVEEFTSQGALQLKWNEPSIRAIFSDNTRDTVLLYHGYKISQTAENLPELIVTLRDSFYPLELRLHYRVIESLDLIVRFAEVVNKGQEPIRLEKISSAEWHLPVKPEGEPYRLSHLVGRWAGEFQLRRQPLTEGSFVIESRYGFTSPKSNPWFALDGFQGEYASEENGAVWYGALAWSGNWKITFQSKIAGRVNVVAGVNDFDFEWFLDAGETFTTPECVGGYTEQGFGQASRNLHRYTLDLVLPRNHVQEIRPVLYNAWEVHYFDVNEQNQMALAERAAALGVELFVVDDGWFGNGPNARNNDYAGLGDWVINREKFPNGLTPLINRVKDLGMRFGLWVEPEMVNPQSELYQQHPDWVYYFPHRERTTQRNQLMLNLARSDVTEYLFNVLDALLTENDITFIKWDYNRNLTEPGWPDASRERQREMWVRHVENLYSILARLRERHPQVVFESCASGGGRVDLGILRYTDQVWTSDNTDAWERLFIQYGFTQAYPIKTMMAWVTDSPNPYTQRKLPVRFRCHVAMAGVMSLGGNLMEWSEEDLAETKQEIAVYKQVRSIIQEGQLYRHYNPEQGFVAFEYVNADKSEAVVLGFLHSELFRRPLPRVFVRGLDANALYRVGDAKETVSGAALSRIGLKLSLRVDFDSCLVHIKRVG